MGKIVKRLMTMLTGFAMMLGVLFIPAHESKAEGSYSFSGVAHIQTYGDKAGTWDGTTLKLGTTGQSKRMESVTLKFENNTGYDGSIEYRVHRQTYGWTDWAGNGQAAGTTGEGKRLEGIQIRLTGELAEHYDVRYRVHIQTYGDSQGWVYNGALAGTTGESKRLERLQVQIIPKSVVTGEPSVSYRVHRQTYGWEQFGKKDGKVSGTTGQGKRLEGIEIFLSGGNRYSGNICYQTHVQTYGWETDWKKDGQMSGTSGKAKRLEAVRIYLTGEIGDYYDVYYRVHAQSYGWLSWACNGQMAGTAGQSKRLEAIQIVLVKKGNPVPGATYNGVTAVNGSCYISSKNESNPPIIPPGNKDESGGSDNGDTDEDLPDVNGDDTTETTECQHEWVEQFIYHDESTEKKVVGYHNFCRGCNLDLDEAFGTVGCYEARIHLTNCHASYRELPVYKEITIPAWNEPNGYKCSVCGATKSE